MVHLTLDISVSTSYVSKKERNHKIFLINQIYIYLHS